ncbi:thiol-disulfide oxidoreductase [Posidoniimonas polymericola]|uniref:Thiol-disulfide oxidoreductase n=1 Tax=Posidoniimonas polymericola TaxID=2528002 RepID=A0A5C5YT20_9BACT|nr:redoxin domain-containing protein [Posidoniimonas polymericola]TWT77883.1 thiol-disulfide oxidoreductase [Posidoniimonas polymericola]
MPQTAPLLLSALLLLYCPPALATPTDAAGGPPAGGSASVLSGVRLDLELPDAYGKNHTLAEFADSRLLVVTFLGTECPLAKLYGPRLQELADQYAEQGVTFIGVDANTQDSLAEITAYARRHDVKFPLLKDNTGEAALSFGATRTPEVFVLDAERRIRYQGRIDDQYGVGYARSAPERHDLRAAIDQLLAGQAVAAAKTEAVGCLIGRRRRPDESSDVTFSNQVSRVLQTHCVECHREGEIGPFALENYEQASGWAEMIDEVVRTKRMPPWDAHSDNTEFANERKMPESDKQVLYDWAAAGAPEGDPANLPPPREFVDGWRLPRDPDMVIPIADKPFKIAAEGTIEYQYFAVDPGFTEDKWIQASDIVPGNRAAVHHVIAFISPPEGEGRRGLGWLSAYVPGQSSMLLPEGQARLAPAGSRIIFQMHYTPTGSPQEDKTKIGLVFADPETVTEEVVTLAALEEKFEIAPHAKDHVVRKTKKHWPAGAKLLAMSPHMHVRGKSFRYDAIWPDGRRETLVDIPNYDFNWQNAYVLAEPLELPPGFAVECTAHFDNSKQNLANPDPSIAVRWGDQTWEEMMIGFFEVAVPRGSYQGNRPAAATGPTDEERQRAKGVAESLFQRFDANRDGAIDRDELPSTFRVFAFNRYDLDGDRIITEDEVYEFALHSDS